VTIHDDEKTMTVFGAQGLTRTEDAVSRKVADGLTNRQIAEELFVTVKAVEFHVHNSFLKLGVQNRTQLALAYLASHPPADQ